MLNKQIDEIKRTILNFLEARRADYWKWKRIESIRDLFPTMSVLIEYTMADALHLQDKVFDFDFSVDHVDLIEELKPLEIPLST